MILSIHRADYVDDDCILELLAWNHPHIIDELEFKFTEEENLVMHGLPRKECMSQYFRA
jgi:hypothetical protein